MRLYLSTNVQQSLAIVIFLQLFIEVLNDGSVVKWDGFSDLFTCWYTYTVVSELFGRLAVDVYVGAGRSRVASEDLLKRFADGHGGNQDKVAAGVAFVALIVSRAARGDFAPNWGYLTIPRDRFRTKIGAT